ncbi:MAG TPA: hypothetical protein VEB64_18715 [Azospirillaceae bacterium]|nr:hypothetical protein [Azospirillaceae bacterium]
MTPEDMGRVFAFLSMHKVASTDPVDRPRRPREREIADLLARDPVGLKEFDEFLAPQGMAIYEFEQAGLGLGPRGRVFVLARAADREDAHWVDDGWLWDGLVDGRRREPLTHTIVWTAQLWAVMNWFFYTREGRTVEAVSGFKDSRLSPTEFIEEAKRRIEALRARGAPDDGRARKVHAILVAADATAIETRIRRFLTVMEQAGMIEPIPGTGEHSGMVGLGYRQTLNAAVEMKLNLHRQAVGLPLIDGPAEADGEG